MQQVAFERLGQMIDDRRGLLSELIEECAVGVDVAHVIKQLFERFNCDIGVQRLLCIGEIELPLSGAAAGAASVDLMR